jgi:hypothetical protein
MPTIHRNPHFTLIHHVASNYVAVVRTAAAFDTHEDVVRSLEQCERALRPLAAATSGILLDWRLGPLSTDPRVHELLVRGSDPFIRRFARKALLVLTPVGAMQGGRIVRVQSTTNPVIFNDEAQAIAYLTER